MWVDSIWYCTQPTVNLQFFQLDEMLLSAVLCPYNEEHSRVELSELRPKHDVVRGRDSTNKSECHLFGCAGDTCNRGDDTDKLHTGLVSRFFPSLRTFVFRFCYQGHERHVDGWQNRVLLQWNLSHSSVVWIRTKFVRAPFQLRYCKLHRS